MKKRYLNSMTIALAAAIGLSANANAQINPISDTCLDARDHGDTLTFALPLSAMAITALKRDGEGGIQLARTMVLTGAGAGTFKAIGDKARPDANTSRQSFVSGHAAGAFMGASYIYTRYGKGWGIPAYTLAIYTAYSRVCAQKHFDDDVLGGALVAMFANWYSTSPYPDSGRLYPSFSSNGIELSFAGFFDGNRHPREPDNFKARYRTVFEFGPVVQSKNIVRAPNQGGTDIDLEALEAEFHMTARLHWEKYLKNGKGEFAFFYGPMGMTDFGQPTEPFRVGDTFFDPSDPDAARFDSNYRWWDVRFSYRHRFVDNDRFMLRAGIGLQRSETQIEVEQRDQNGTIVKNGQEDVDGIHPVLHLGGALKFNERWSIEFEVDGIGDNKNDYVNVGTWIRYRPTQIWDLSLGGRLIHGTIDESEMFNEVEIEDIAFQIGRSF